MEVPANRTFQRSIRGWDDRTLASWRVSYPDRAFLRDASRLRRCEAHACWPGSCSACPFDRKVSTGSYGHLGSSIPIPATALRWSGTPPRRASRIRTLDPRTETPRRITRSILLGRAEIVIEVTRYSAASDRLAFRLRLSRTAPLRLRPKTTARCTPRDGENGEWSWGISAAIAALLGRRGALGSRTWLRHYRCFGSRRPADGDCGTRRCRARSR